MKHILFLVTLTQLIIAQTLSGIPILSDYLWKQTAHYQQQALNSNLIFGMTKHCLDPSEFAGFLVDDAAYITKGSESLNISAARSNDNATLQMFMEREATEWFEYWKWMKEIVHVAHGDGIAMGDAAKAYVNHIKNVAENEIPIYTLLALTPCAKLWPWLGEQLGSGTKYFGVYTSWVEENFNPNSTGYKEFQDHVEWAYDAGIVAADKALDIFTASIQHEVNFFNSVGRCNPSNTLAMSRSEANNVLDGELQQRLYNECYVEGCYFEEVKEAYNHNYLYNQVSYYCHVPANQRRTGGICDM